jgi:hypothetical protein
MSAPLCAKNGATFVRGTHRRENPSKSSKESLGTLVVCDSGVTLGTVAYRCALPFDTMSQREL